MRNSTFRDPLTYPYLSALSAPNEDFYITDNPLRSYARQPTGFEDAAGHVNTQTNQAPGEGDMGPLEGMFDNLTPHSPYTIDSREISPISEEAHFTQSEESFLPSAAATEQALRDFIKIPQSRPLDLSSLRDITNVARLPNLTHLAALAIWASPSKRLTLSEIYEAIEARYPILKNQTQKKWKESLRHRLSLKAVFIRVGQTERGKRGGYWVLDVSKGLNENKRPRKKGSGGAQTVRTTPTGAQSLSLSDRDDQGSSDYSDFSHRSSASLSPPASHGFSVNPILNQLNYQLSETNISAHHGSPTSGSPDITQAPYSSDNLMLHPSVSLGYSSAQGSTSFYAHSGFEYELHHSPTPPNLNVSEHLFSNEDVETELDELDLNRSSSSNMRSYQPYDESPDYDSRLDL